MANFKNIEALKCTPDSTILELLNHNPNFVDLISDDIVLNTCNYQINDFTVYLYKELNGYIRPTLGWNDSFYNKSSFLIANEFAKRVEIMLNKEYQYN